MKRGPTYRCHKRFVKMIKSINKSFEDDDWFNGRFKVKLVKFFRWHESDPNYAPGWDLLRWMLVFIDDKNPLNTAVHLTDSHYVPTQPTYQYPNYSDEFWHIHSDINKSLNSWIQFCESGQIFDSPPGCRMSSFDFNHFMKYNSYINNLPTDSITPEVHDEIKHVISTFDSNKSFVYDSFNNRVDVKETTCLLDKRYTASGLLWMYGNGALLYSDDIFKSILISVDGQVYYIKLHRDIRFKPKSDELTSVAYKINIEDYDTEYKEFELWLQLNGFKK